MLDGRQLPMRVVSLQRLACIQAGRQAGADVEWQDRGLGWRNRGKQWQGEAGTVIQNLKFMWR